MTPEQMQKIVDSAPIDATDIDHTGAYWKDDLMMVDDKYQEDDRGWALIKWRLSHLRTQLNKHNTSDLEPTNVPHDTVVLEE
jgi:hypothetical protein